MPMDGKTRNAIIDFLTAKFDIVTLELALKRVFHGEYILAVIPELNVLQQYTATVIDKLYKYDDEALTNYLEGLKKYTGKSNQNQLDKLIFEVKTERNISSLSMSYDKDYADNFWAVDYYTQAIALDDNNLYAYIQRGHTYEKMGQYEDAIADYFHVLELDPNYVDAYWGRGDAYYKLKEYEAAIADYRDYERLAGGLRTSMEERIMEMEEALNGNS